MGATAHRTLSQSSFEQRLRSAIASNTRILPGQAERAFRLCVSIMHLKGEDAALAKAGSADLRILAVSEAAYRRGENGKSSRSSARQGRFAFADPLNEPPDNGFNGFTAEASQNPGKTTSPTMSLDEMRRFFARASSSPIPVRKVPGPKEVKDALRERTHEAFEFLRGELNTFDDTIVVRISQSLIALYWQGMLESFKRSNPESWAFLEFRFGLRKGVIMCLSDTASYLNTVLAPKKFNDTSIADLERKALADIAKYVAQNEERLKTRRFSRPVLSKPEKPRKDPELQRESERRLRELCNESASPRDVITSVLYESPQEVIRMMTNAFRGITNAEIAALLMAESEHIVTLTTDGQEYYGWSKGGPGRHTPIYPVSGSVNPADILRGQATKIERIIS